MSDYIDFIDSNGNEWTRTTRFREARETIAAQAAVIEKLREAIKAVEIDSEEVLDFDEFTAMMVPMDTYHALIEALAIPTDSTQILNEVRRAERERVAQYVQQGTGDWMLGKKIAEAIRAME